MQYYTKVWLVLQDGTLSDELGVTVAQAAWASLCDHVTGPAMQRVCRTA